MVTRDDVQAELVPDPAIDAYKKDVDRTLLRENLRLTPEQRLRKLQDFVAFLTGLRSAGGRPADRP
jgi:hypothetical protein